MTILFSDTGVGADGALGNGWATPAANPGTFDRLTNRIRYTGATAGVIFNATGLGTVADYEVQADIVQTTGDNAGLIGRAVDGSNYYVLHLDGAGSVALFKSVAGGFQQLGATVSYGGVAGTTYTCKLSMIGNQIRAFVGGVERIRATDTQFTAPGSFGLRGVGTAAEFFTNFSVNDVPVIAINDANLITAPGVWLVNGAVSIKTNMDQAYVRLGFTGTTLVAKIANGNPAYSLYWSIDGGAWTTSVPANTDTVITFTATALAAGNHTLELYVVTPNDNFDRWTTPVQFFQLNNFLLDAGAATIAPPFGPRRAKKAMLLTDSKGHSGSPALTNEFYAYALRIGEAIGAELGCVSISSQGWNQAPANSTNFPTFHTVGANASQSWRWYWNGQARTADLAALDYIIVEQGTNGAVTTATVNDFLTQLRAVTAAKIFLVVPFGRFNAAAIKAATLPTNAVLVDLDPNANDLSVGLTNTGASRRSGDGLHPNQVTHGEVAARLSQALQAQLGGGGGGGGARQPYIL